MKLIVLILSILCYTNGYTQNVEKPNSEPESTEESVEGKKKYTKAQLDSLIFNESEVDEQPKFTGSFLKFLEINLKYPEAAIKNNIQGKVIIDFVVDKKGNLSNFKLSDQSETNNELLVNETLRILKKTAKGKWVPAKIGSKMVQCAFSQSIMFLLPE
jgi:periplasmic protein TonB